MNNLKFLIILVYYKRPTIVLNALHSIKNLNYENWELYFIDDSGNEDFKNTLFDYGIDKSKINYISILDSDEKKLKQGGSRHGKFMNESILNSNSDITTILCDDDALVSDSLTKLNNFYLEDKTRHWGHSKVYFYDPEVEFYKDSGNKEITNYTHLGSTYELNKYNNKIFPANLVDGSQVTFKNYIFKQTNVRYPYPQTRNLDSSILNQIASVCGPCPATNIFTQYKAVFANQMGNRWASTRTEYIND